VVIAVQVVEPLVLIYALVLVELPSVLKNREPCGAESVGAPLPERILGVPTLIPFVPLVTVKAPLIVAELLTVKVPFTVKSLQD
jgi:hypothetical protein